MRTIHTETTVYKFEELPIESQEKAIERYWDINVDYAWWDAVYEDAERIGLKITGFGLDRNRHAEGELLVYPTECAERILKEHGEHCETYQTAKTFLEERTALVKEYSDGVNIEEVTEENEYDFDQECDDLEAELVRSLLEDYSIILQKEYEYLSSGEAIQETLIANEYEFTIDGKIY